MAISKYYSNDDQTPAIPEAGGDYGHPTPHSSVADQRPFVAPNTNVDGTFGGVGSVTPNDYMFGNPATAASYTPTVGNASDIAQPGGQDAANAAFDAIQHGGQQYRP